MSVSTPGQSGTSGPSSHGARSSATRALECLTPGAPRCWARDAGAGEPQSGIPQIAHQNYRMVSALELHGDLAPDSGVVRDGGPQTTKPRSWAWIGGRCGRPTTTDSFYYRPYRS